MAVIKKYSPLICPIIVLLFFSVLFACNNIYPFGELTISWCDMDQQTIPLLCAFKDVLSGKSDLWLSLANAGGMNFFGVYFFNLSSPFTYLIAFFPKEEIPLAVNIMVVLKLALASCTMAIYLRYAVKNANSILIIAFSTLYAFCGWAMMYYQILSWLDTLYVFPLLLLGLQKLTEGKSPALYIISLFLCILFHFYLGYAVVIFICLYAFVHAFKVGKEQSKEFCKNFILSSAVAALISAIVIIPCFMQYLSSMRSGGLIQGLATEYFFPPIETSLPTFFCLLTFIPFVIFSKKASKLSELAILFLFMLVPVIIEPIACAWQTFSYMAFPTRYGFITTALGLTLILKCVTELLSDLKSDGQTFLGTFTKKEYLKAFISVFSVAFCIAFAVFSYRFYNQQKEVITSYSQTLWGDKKSFILLTIYYLVLFIFGVLLSLAVRYKIVHKIAVYGVIALLCCVEICFSSSVYMIKPANDYATFKRSTQINNLINDEDFYRVKTYRKYFPVNLIGGFGYNSLAHYTSLNSQNYMLMVKELGYSSYWMEVNSNGGTIFTDALLRNKYCIYSGSKENAVYTTQNYSVVQNDIIFPTAFLIDQTGNNKSDQTKERWQIQNDLFTRLTGKEGLYTKYDYSISQCENVNDISNSDYFAFELVNNQKIGKIIFNVNIGEECALYFDCFDGYSNNLNEHVNDTFSAIVVRKNGSAIGGSSYQKYPTQINNGCVYLGTFSNVSLQIEIRVENDFYANSFGVFSVDTKMLESAVNSAIGGDFVVNGGGLSGKIYANDSNSALFTCLPFDKGFSATVNGKSEKVYNVNGFLAVNLSQGENQVKIAFSPQGLTLGIICFCIGVMLFVAYFVFNKKIQKFTKLNQAFYLITLALGVVVIAVIYFVPVAINLIL